MSKNFHLLRIKEVIRETEDAVTLAFEVPESLSGAFQYQSGQYITIKLEIGGREQRRSYSMSSSPLEPGLAVSVKRVKGGLVSGYLTDRVKAGDQLEIMEPDGRFHPVLDAEQRKTYYMIGAGSGITPLFSMIKTILEEEPQSTVHLLYGNRTEESIMFRSQLDQLLRRYDAQFTVDHVLSKPRREKPSGIAGLFSKGTLSWQGKTGRIGVPQLEEFLEANPVRGREAVYFICGPGNLIDTVEAALVGRGIPAAKIHTERFVTAPVAEADKIKGLNGAKVQVQLNGQQLVVEVPSGKTILDVLIDKKYNPPYSCTSGACSTCIAKVTEGSVRMDVCYALDEEEVARGYILTCQAHPVTPQVSVTFDV
jgi:ring-1,2-phenylacetyl-CoA epoxidase subunit PaaE